MNYQPHKKQEAKMINEGHKLEPILKSYQELFFSWVQPYLEFGNKNTLQLANIPKLPKELASAQQYLKYEKELNFFKGQENSFASGFLFLKVILKSQTYLILKGLILSLISNMLLFMTPYIIKIAISQVQNSQRHFSDALLLILTIFCVKIIENLAQSHLQYTFATLGLNLINDVNISLYTKAFRYPTLFSKKYRSAEIINLSEIDSQRLYNFGWVAADIVCSPIKFLIGIYIMYSFVGVSFLAGLGIILNFVIFTSINSKFEQIMNQTVLDARSERMKVTNQIFNSIRFIKVNAWEKLFYNKLYAAREDQLNKKKQYSIVEVIAVFLSLVSSPLILICTFLLYIQLGNQLTPQMAFTTITSFKILQSVIKDVPWTISYSISIWISIKKIEQFIFAGEIQKPYIKQDETSANAIEIKNGYFYWEVEQKEVSSQEKTEQIQYIEALVNINVKIPKNKFTVILGNVGSGKSSLFYSVLGQMKPHRLHVPSITINGKMAFVSQKPWILSCSIQENILMGSQKDQKRLKQAIKYSCLEKDLTLLSNGLNTIIGEKGINLSGGQKARLSLARALYLNREIYLLDDILSAVDSKVSNYLVDQTLLNYLGDKSRILITHSSSLAKSADMIIIMDNGQIIEAGSYQQIRFTKAYKDIEKQENLKQEKPKFQRQMQNCEKQLNEKTNTENTNQSSIVQQLVLAEDRQTGEISSNIYKNYMDLSGGWAALIFLLCVMMLFSFFSTLSNVQIKTWCQQQLYESNMHLTKYALFSLTSVIFLCIQIVFLVTSSLKLSRTMHQKAVNSLIYASIPQFFDRIPVGRILNRLSNDLNQIDESVALTVGNTLIQIFTFINTIIICVYSSSWLLLVPVAISMCLANILRKYYNKTKIQTKRIQNSSYSPIVTTFAQTINGLTTIRASNLCDTLKNKLFEQSDLSKKASLFHSSLKIWFGIRLCWISFIINISAISLCIFNPTSTSASVGFVLSFAFNINDSIKTIYQNLIYTESALVGLQRVLSFTKVEPEKGYKQINAQDNKQIRKPIPIFKEGTIKFNNFSLRYRQNLPYVLKDLNCIIKAKQKIGVVGRTGAGKSTITAAILRIIQASEGKILIDDLDISSVNLYDLRSNITLIQQDPILIDGTLRENLDPTNQYQDYQLKDILNLCLDQREWRSGLQTIITGSGDDLSVGEKQLICIARAILKKAKIVLIDEATANIDNKSDNLIQKIIKASFINSTVITIAHRLNTIMSSDRIMVLQEGRIKQFDSPQRLLAIKGTFYEMYKESLKVDK